MTTRLSLTLARARRSLPVGLAVLATLVGAASVSSARPAPRPASGSSPAGLPIVDVPETLRPWTAWVLHDHQAALCPPLDGEDDATHCAWPARLSLVLDGKGGRFSQQWRAFNKTQVPLPGGAERWPQDVRVDGKAAIVVPDKDDEKAAAVLLPSGDHTITGAFFWDELPESLEVPSETGLLALSLQGKEVALPSRDAEGKVWLQKQAAPKVEADVLEVAVHRRVDDEIPLVLTTRIELRVAGKNREVVLGRALPDGFVPMSLESAVPARVESDGRLRVQVRPGTYVLTLVARHAEPDGAVASLARPNPEGPWTEGDEVWVFDARPSLRLVTVEGVAAIDPQQTTLPDDWKRLPAYPMKLGDHLKLVEQRRGDTDPAPDQLQLSRQFWLDFDGGGYTVTDRLTGTLHRAWRLEVNEPTVLGRVAVGGKDQFITRVATVDAAAVKGKSPGVTDGKARAGVEIRQGTVDLSADSRIVGHVGDLPAVSWDADFQHVEGVLHLPPGWRLFHASGADEVPGTWIRHWSLLDIFLALIIAMAIGRLYGAGWGGLALVALVLVFPEDDAPRWTFLGLLAVEALLRVLPRGRLDEALRIARLGARVLLALAILSFAARHVRHAIYPALEREEASTNFPTIPMFGTSAQMAQMAPPPTGAPAMKETTVGGAPSAGAAAPDEENALVPRKGGAAKSRKADKALLDALDGEGGSVVDSARRGYSASKNVQQAAQMYDPNAMVQTGPGLPRWSWSTLAISWSGPVERGQVLRLVLLPPSLNLVLAWVRVLLLLLLLLRLIEPPLRFLPGVLRGTFGGAGAAILAFLVIAGVPRSAHAQLPNKELLDELRERLFKKASCRPRCASSSRLALDVQPRLLRMRLEVDAAAPTAVPLPGKGDQWAPEQVSLDGKPAPALLRTDDGRLWLELGEGSHEVLLEGKLPARETVQLALPMKSHRVEAKVEGWQLDGLHEDGLADEYLQLTRVRGGKEEAETGASLQPGALPAFVRVVREVHIGLQWELDTHVVRVTPTGTAVVLEVPLLPGESVTTADVRVVGGKALVNMAPSATETTWHSLLQQRSPIKLLAPRGLPWVEEWRLDASPIWHVEPSGIPVVHQQDEAGLRLPWWKPWPGEAVSIDVTRPEGVPGQTLTIDHSALVVDPGLRATDATLTLDVRSSRGGQHVLTLPDGAVLQSAEIDGRTQPIRQDKRRVTIPLMPGHQSVKLTWRQPAALSLRFVTPDVDLGTPSVNADLTIDLPSDRWTLLAGGPRLGPAVLFWSMLLVLLWVAIGLGQIRWTPLRTPEWLLLGLGLSQVELPLAAVVAGWLLLLGWREQRPAMDSHVGFNVRQLFLVGGSLLALGILAGAIYDGLLGQPEMQITGNGSASNCLRWFQDRSEATLPHAWVLSVPMMVYRVAMLLWALWIARALLQWLRWGWGAMSRGGIWKRPPPRPAPTTPPTTTRAPAPTEGTPSQTPPPLNLPPR